GATRGQQAPARATAVSLQVIHDHVPLELIALHRWVAWDGTRQGNGKLDKTPLNVRNGRKARSNAPGTWGSFQQALQFALHDARVGGLGLVLTDSDYWALDLDHVIDIRTG